MILVTGGAGFIGSHTCVELLNSNEEVVIIDNLSNSKIRAVDAIKEITGKNLVFVKEDLRNESALNDLFGKYSIDCVVHFAALKAVGESVAKPLLYCDNNVGGTLSLLKAMERVKVNNLVFSSSSCVYGMSDEVPYVETTRLDAINPYGATKLYIENLCRQCGVANADFSAVLLRYFNPIGAHESFKIGEDPNGIPNNLVPIIMKIALGKYKVPKLQVFGNDYSTRDGTCIRDYIHVTDVARAHVKAVKFARENKGVEAFNIGTGRGSSVLEVIESFNRVNSQNVGYDIVGRRAGDAPESYCSCAKAEKVLDWKAVFNLDKMVEDAWNYGKRNY